MNRYLISAISLLMTAGAASAVDSAPAPTAPETATASSPAVLVSGILTDNMDKSVRVQDDFYQYVNGTWLKKTEIPADKSGWGAFYALRESVLPRVRSLIEEADKDPNKTSGSEAQKIGDLYASFMDEKKLEELGLKPLDGDFAKIAALKDKKQLPELFAYLGEVGVTLPIGGGVHLDNRDSTKYEMDFSQDGLGLPDRDYYLKNDAKMKEARTNYVAHITKMLTMAGDKPAVAKAKAQRIFKLETEIAKAQWTKVQMRDPVKAYNKTEVADLNKLTPNFDWKVMLTDSGLDGKVTYVNISQPSYFKSFDKLVKATPLSTWKEYLQWHVLTAASPYLSKQFSDENFAFYGTALNGTPEQPPRWKRAVGLEEGVIGEGIGKMYVAKYFPPEYKARMEKLVGNLLQAFDQSIDTLDWMGPDTKKEAKAKLAAFTPKIGYPAKWRDYTALQIKADDLMGNVTRANVFEYNRNINKLGQPVDRGEWGMTPQTINAYYNPEMNEIVFPAAILQPPFFNADADDAVNYGAIGAVIGHEISHGFDDQGAQYDGKGNLRDWWTKEDHEKFAAKTAALVKQYGAYSPIPGYKVNGELTLGENIADNSGLAIALKAYKLSLGGKEAPVIDGMTGEQRFYLGFGQVWAGKMRENAAIVRIKTDPHSPPQFRGNGTVKNQPGFYEAFGVKEGDAMYLPPDQRVIMW